MDKTCLHTSTEELDSFEVVCKLCGNVLRYSADYLVNDRIWGNEYSGRFVGSKDKDSLLTSSRQIAIKNRFKDLFGKFKISGTPFKSIEAYELFKTCVKSDIGKYKLENLYYACFYLVISRHRIFITFRQIVDTSCKVNECDVKSLTFTIVRKLKIPYSPPSVSDCLRILLQRIEFSNEDRQLLYAYIMKLINAIEYINSELMVPYSLVPLCIGLVYTALQSCKYTTIISHNPNINKVCQELCEHFLLAFRSIQKYSREFSKCLHDFIRRADVSVDLKMKLEKSKYPAVIIPRCLHLILMNIEIMQCRGETLEVSYNRSSSELRIETVCFSCYRIAQRDLLPEYIKPWYIEHLTDEMKVSFESRELNSMDLRLQSRIMSCKETIQELLERQDYR